LPVQEVSGDAHGAIAKHGESFGAWYGWRSALFQQGLRPLTVGMATGKDQNAQALFTLFIF
jgi:hypothetical protein